MFLISRLGTPPPPLTWSNFDPMDIFILATSTRQGNEQNGDNDDDDEGNEEEDNENNDSQV